MAVSPQRYRAEVGEGGVAVPPRPNKLRPLKFAGQEDEGGNSSPGGSFDEELEDVPAKPIQKTPAKSSLRKAGAEVSGRPEVPKPALKSARSGAMATSGEQAGRESAKVVEPPKEPQPPPSPVKSAMKKRSPPVEDAAQAEEAEQAPKQPLVPQPPQLPKSALKRRNVEPQEVVEAAAEAEPAALKPKKGALKQKEPAPEAEDNRGTLSSSPDFPSSPDTTAPHKSLKLQSEAGISESPRAQAQARLRSKKKAELAEEPSGDGGAAAPPGDIGPGHTAVSGKDGTADSGFGRQGGADSGFGRQGGADSGFGRQGGADSGFGRQGDDGGFGRGGGEGGFGRGGGDGDNFHFYDDLPARASDEARDGGDFPVPDENDPKWAFLNDDLDGSESGSLSRFNIPFQRMSSENHMMPLNLCDLRPETWSVRGLMTRWYFRAAQEELWGVPAQLDELIEEQLNNGNLQYARRGSQHPGPGFGALVDVDLDDLDLDAPMERLESIHSGNETVAPLASASMRPGQVSVDFSKMQKSTTVVMFNTPDIAEEGEESAIAALRAKSSTQESLLLRRTLSRASRNGTESPELDEDEHPLKAVLSAKKVDVKKVKAAIQGARKLRHWINVPISDDPPLPTALFVAIGATLPEVVQLLLDNGADVKAPFDGEKMYNGWIKPGATPLESVTNRHGRFIGTMLGDRLEAIMEILKEGEAAAARREQGDSSPFSRQPTSEVAADEGGAGKKRKSKKVKMSGARGTIQHTQGHPSEQYDVLQVLFDGTLSSVKLAVQRQTGQKRAIKSELKLEESLIWEELALMRKLNHPNVITLYETFEDRNTIFAVLELCTGGDLIHRLAESGGVDEHDSARLLHQFAAAIEYIHSVNVCHRDVQLENFVLKDQRPLNEAEVVLIDFTMAKEFGPQSPMKTKLCNLYYVAPEMLTKKDISYTEKIDVWSLGVIYWVVLSGSFPFYSADEIQVLKKIKKGSYKFQPAEVWDYISPTAKDLLSNMLVVDVNTRFDAEEVANHPWFKNDLSYKAGPPASARRTVTDSDQINQLRTLHLRTRMQKVVSKVKGLKLSEPAVVDLRKLFETSRTKPGPDRSPFQALKEGLSSLNLGESTEEVARLIFTLDPGDGNIVEFETFMSAMVERQRVGMLEAYKAIFDIVDQDRDTFLSREELLEAFKLHSEIDSRSRETRDVPDEPGKQYSYDDFLAYLQEGD